MRGAVQGGGRRQDVKEGLSDPPAEPGREYPPLPLPSHRPTYQGSKRRDLPHPALEEKFLPFLGGDSRPPPGAVTHGQCAHLQPLPHAGTRLVPAGNRGSEPED